MTDKSKKKMQQLRRWMIQKGYITVGSLAIAAEISREAVYQLVRYPNTETTARAGAPALLKIGKILEVDNATMLEWYEGGFANEKDTDII